jgi:PAS domain S-box-containing protein
MAGMVFTLIDGQRVPGMPWWPPVVSFAIGAALLGLLISRRREPTVLLGSVTFTFNTLAVLLTLWIRVPYFAYWEWPGIPFQMHKLGALTVGLLMPEAWAGGFSIAAYIIVGLVQFAMLPPPLRTGSGEPWAMFAYGLFAAGVLAYRVHQLRLEQGYLRAQAEREARELLSAVVQNVPVALYAVDRNGRFLLCEGKALEAIGFKPGELLGKNAFDAWGQIVITDSHTGEPVPAREVLRRVLAGTLFVGEATIQGRERETTMVPLRDHHTGAVVGVGIVAYDVTERKRLTRERRSLLEQEASARRSAEESTRRLVFLFDATTRLLEEEQDLRKRIERAAQVMVPVLGDYCLIDLLRAGGGFERVAGAAADSEKAALLDEVRHYPLRADATTGPGLVARTGKPQVVANVAEFQAEGLERALSSGIATNDQQFRLQRALNAHSYMVLPLKARGRILGTLSLIASRPDLRYTASERALAEDLASRIALVLDGAQLFDEAQQAIHARDEFLSVASHELRTPLTPLQVATELLEKLMRKGELERAPHEVVSRMLGSILRQTERMKRLVSSMLDVTRIQAGRLELRLATIDLAEVTREVCAEYEAELAKAGCELELDADQPVIGRWDADRIEQVVVNLLSNAIKYAAGKPITVSVRKDGDSGRLTVADRGIGIAPEQQRAIFGRFERAVPIRSYGGLGLGLYIVNQILAAHGGTIRVESAPGKGSVFTVELPLRGPLAVAPVADAG